MTFTYWNYNREGVWKGVSVWSGNVDAHARGALQDLFLRHLDVAVLGDGDYVHPIAAGGIPLHGRVQGADGQVDGFIKGYVPLVVVLQHAVGVGGAGTDADVIVRYRSTGGVQ